MVNYDRHTFISGITDSGKTTFANFMYETLRGIKIFFNTQHELMVFNNSQCMVNDLGGLKKAFERNYKKICFSPDPMDDKKVLELIRLKNFLFNVGEQINADCQRKIWCYLFVDEIHRLSPCKSPVKQINVLWTSGYRYGVTMYGIAQRPALTDTTILAETKNHVIYDIGLKDRAYYLKNFKVDIDQYNYWLNRPFHYIVFDGKEIEDFTPIKQL